MVLPLDKPSLHWVTVVYKMCQCEFDCNSYG